MTIDDTPKPMSARITPPRQDVLAVLYATKRLTKRWRSDGSIEPYDDAKMFTLAEHRVSSIHELSALLTRLEPNPRACVIRGLHDEATRDREPDLPTGKVYRRKSLFRDQALHSLMIEIDDFEPLFADPVTDPAAAIEEYLKSHLPVSFQCASFHWQLSNSAGHSKHHHKLKAHLWFWLATPRTSAALRAWARGIGLQADHAVFDEIQVHYTAAPEFDTGVADPVPVRSGFVHGLIGDEVELDIGDLPPRPVATSSRIEDLHLDRQIALQDVTEATIADLRSALAHIAPRAEPYSDWIHTGQALASLKGTEHEAAAQELWHEFSKQSDKYNAEQAQEKWEGFAPHSITFRSIFAWAQASGWVNPRVGVVPTADDYSTLVDRTDTGNANLLEKLTAGNLRFVPETESWLWWDGERWTPDKHGMVARARALRVAEHYHEKVAELEAVASDPALDEGERDRIKKTVESLRKWERQCRQRRVLDAMLFELSKRAAIAVPIDRLDRDPWLLGVENGVLDLRTGELRPAAREDLVTKRSTVRYDPAARAPRFEAFVKEITGSPIPAGRDPATGEVRRDSVGCFKERPALARYLQRALAA